ncbi:MAG TPA: pyridoxal-phosphate dependent enzyme [Firmicutes bacterium]|nr:pyridoxal-phosphate dependent enzyme [Bacillota bacterium]
MIEPTIADIKEAAARISPYTHRTPIFTSATVNRLAEAEVFFKCENLQKTGAFKARGAINAVYSIAKDSAGNGVATHSSGNHAAALAYAARCRGIKAFVVMPENAPPVKIAAVAEYGAEIKFCPPTQKDREETLQAVVRDRGAVAVHPYNDHKVIAGQATAAHELLEEVPRLDALITPVGGGGLLSGTLLAVSASKRNTAVYGAEPAGADDAYRSLQAGHLIPVQDPDTIADGLRTSLGNLTFPIIQKYAAAILTVDDPIIIGTMKMLWERMKLIVEPSAVLPVAVLLHRREQIRANRIGLIISGGNVDLDYLPWQSGSKRKE